MGKRKDYTKLLAVIAKNHHTTVAQAAEKWNRSERWVQTLCLNGRIEGAYRPARDWLISADAECPKDRRRRENRGEDKA